MTISLCTFDHLIKQLFSLEFMIVQSRQPSLWAEFYYLNHLYHDKCNFDFSDSIKNSLELGFSKGIVFSFCYCGSYYLVEGLLLIVVAIVTLALVSTARAPLRKPFLSSRQSLTLTFLMLPLVSCLGTVPLVEPPMESSVSRKLLTNVASVTFSLTNSDQAQSIYSSTTFTVCGGNTLVASGCGCTGDEFFRLYDSSNSAQLSFDDDSTCGLCSIITYSVSGDAEYCPQFVLRMGCFDVAACSGPVDVSYFATTLSPTMLPTFTVSARPTAIPTLKPSVLPTVLPTVASASPSVIPTQAPSAIPSVMPTVGPSVKPSVMPSIVPTVIPSLVPTIVPTVNPSIRPTLMPSMIPTIIPTVVPSVVPSLPPSCLPTVIPSLSPTELPTIEPSVVPTVRPTISPSVKPTVIPTIKPSKTPSLRPTVLPTLSPTEEPTESPTRLPTVRPSTQRPTVVPSRYPTERPVFSDTPSVLPTMKPTTPTGAPSAPPTKSIVPPEIGSADVNVSRTSMVVTATFTMPTVYDGYLYVNALASGANLTSVSQIVTGTSSYYAMGSTIASATISGLDASTKYDVYIYVQSTAGYSMSLTQVKNTLATVTTACCKSLVFTNAPANVYGDTDIYTNNGISTSNFVFTYSLSSTPDSDLTVWAVVENANSGSGRRLTGDDCSSITVTPPFANYSASTKSVSGSFLLSSGFSMDTQCQLALAAQSVSGDYNSLSPAVTITVLAPTSPLPAPKLSYCTFGDSGTYVNIGFDSATNKGGIVDNAWNCSLLFSFAGSNTATCTWSNTTVAKATFAITSNSASLLVNNGNVTVLAGKIAAQCITTNCSSYPTNVGASVKATYSSTSVAPVPIISAPQQVTSCSNLILDATLSSGSGSRPWVSTSWTVTGVLNSDGVTAVNTSAIAAVLRSVNVQTSQIVISSSLLRDATYSFSLTLVNFMGKSGTAYATVVVSGNVNIPTLVIQGSSSLSVTPADGISVSAKATVSACSTNQAVTYSWSIYLNGADSGIVSTSKAGNVLLLNPYSLAVGNVYQAKVTATVVSLDDRYGDGVATAQVSIIVGNGKVVAVVQGGAIRTQAITDSQPLTIDASKSYDANVGTGGTQTLKYSWSCKIASVSNYGTDCSSVFGSGSTSGSAVTLLGSNVDPSITYYVTVLVSSVDGRYDSSTITVNNLGANGPFALISSTAMRFNVDSRVSLRGTVGGSTDIVANWSASVSGQTVLFAPLSKNPQYYSAAQASSQMYSTLVVPAYTFVAGADVTFQLVVSDSTGVSSTASVIVAINAPPIGGYLAVDPNVGTGLVTPFLMSALSWSDDPSDYPLSYDFSYILNVDSLTVKSKSSSNIVTTQLPGGWPSRKYQVTVVSRVYDVYSAATSASTVVNVTANTNNTFIANYVTTNLAAAASSGDNDQSMQVINNVASSFNTLNCSLAPSDVCASLNRDECSEVTNTCGSCLPGFFGIAGSSNLKCLSEVVSSCSLNSECPYGLCSNGTCSVPRLKCVSGTSGAETECSNQGHCSYSDTSGNNLDFCYATDTFCTATCVCNPGFGGSDCSLTSSDLASRDASRTAMCDALIDVIESSNPSSTMIESLLSSLVATFNPGEVITGVGSCYEVLSALTDLAAQGYIVGAGDSLGSALVNSLSSFFTPNASVSLDVSGVIANITNALLQNSISGQTSQSFTTDNVKVTVVRDSVDDASDSTYSTPTTESESSYGVAAPSLSFANGSSSACDDGNGYLRLTVTSYGINPYSGSSDVTAPIFRTQTYSSGSRRRLSNSSFTDHSRTESLSFTPAFYFTLQFSTVQNFDFSVDPNSAEAKTSNVTFPLCRVYDGSKYVPCDSCNITSYTNYNVTYGCSDISQLCAGSSSTRRLLYSNPESESYYEQIGRGPSASRSLFTLSGDDDGTEEETGVGSVSEFSAITANLIGEARAVFSVNIFAINVKEAKPVLILISILFFIFVFGLAYFARWDRLDHHMLMYTKVEKDARKRKEAREKMAIYDFYNRKSKKKQLEKRTLIGFLTSNKKVFAKKKHGMTDEAAEYHEHTTKIAMRQQTLNYDDLEDLEKHAEEEISLFLSLVMPVDNKIIKNKQFEFFHALKEEHEYINMFTFASIHRSRASRWINAFMGVMICIFLDTIFFGQFYADKGLCETYVNDKSGCLTPFNKAANRNTCKWTPSDAVDAADGSGTCEMMTPPASVVFTVIIMLLTIIIGVPLNLLYTVLAEAVCAKRPNLEKIGLNSSFWLNSQSQGMKRGSAQYMSGLQTVFREAEDVRNEVLPLEGVTASEFKETLLKQELQDINLRAHRIYHGTVSTVEEVDQIYAEIAAFIEKQHHHVEVPWKSSSSSFTSEKAKAEAIEHWFNVDVSGRQLGLSLRQWLTYGSQRGRIESKVHHVRKRMHHIAKRLEGCGEPGSIERDIALVQFFILEQFNVYKRYALRHQFFNFDASTPRLIHPLVWILGWLFVICSFGFFLYWVLAWAVLNGPKTFRSWGINFCLSVMHDVLIIQVVKVWVLFVLAMYSIRPQLNFINRTLSKIALDYTQNGTPAISNSREIRVVQHMSPACRVARLNVSHGLASATILNQMDDIDWKVCRMNSTRKMVSFAFMLLLLPALFSIAHVLVGEVMLETLIPSVFTGFLLANYYISVQSVGGLIAIYIVALCFVLWRVYLLAPAAKKVQKIKAKAKKTTSPDELKVHWWHSSRKSLHSRSFIKFVRYCLNAFSVGLYWLTRWIMSPYINSQKRTSKQRKDDNAWKIMNGQLMRFTRSSLPETVVITPRRLLSKIFHEQQAIHGKTAQGSRGTTPSGSARSVAKRSPRSSPAVSDHSQSPYHGHNHGHGEHEALHVWKVHNLVHTQSGVVDAHQGRLDILQQLPPEIKSMHSNVNDWKPEREMESGKNNYLTQLLNRHLLDFDISVGENQKVVVGDAVPVPDRTRRPLSQQYINNNRISTNADEALVRLMRKHGVGETAEIAAAAAASGAESTDAYLLSILPHHNFNEKVKIGVLNSIMIKFFQIHNPNGIELSEEELEEVRDLYRSWLTSHQLDDQNVGDEVEFSSFRDWFLKLIATINVCYQHIHSLDE